MEERTPGTFEQLREEIVNTPELQQPYEHTKRTVLLLRQVLMEIDAERERAGLTKAELARRIGAAPSVVRRIFSSRSGNPSLRTAVAMAVALDLNLECWSSNRAGAMGFAGLAGPGQCWARSDRSGGSDRLDCAVEYPNAGGPAETADPH